MEGRSINPLVCDQVSMTKLFFSDSMKFGTEILCKKKSIEKARNSLKSA